MAEELTLGDKVDKLTDMIESGALKEPKPKPFRMPFAGKVGNIKLKQGYVTVFEIAENGATNFGRHPVIDGTIKLRDTYHAVDAKDCLIYKGKPLVIIPKKSSEPYNPNYVKNNTFSQKHIMSRMMNEVLDSKKTIGWGGISIGAVILIAIVGYALIAG